MTSSDGTLDSPHRAARRDDVALERGGVEYHGGGRAGTRRARGNHVGLRLREHAGQRGIVGGVTAPVARTSTTRNAACACTAGSVCDETLAS